MDPEQLLQLLMQLLTQSPDLPAGEVPSGLPPAGVPSSMREMSEEHQMLAMLNQFAQQILMQQSGQQMQNGVQGAAGGMYGSMGGRPPGS
jgi:hypothetical protein